jgi:DNA-directed RNA polymerase alpha subunit
MLPPATATWFTSAVCDRSSPACEKQTEEKMSAGKPGKSPWTQNEVRRLKGLVKKALDCEEISRLLHRPPSAVIQKAFWLNLPVVPQLKKPTPELSNDTPIIDVQFPIRLFNMLNAAGIKTVGEIRETPNAELMRFQHCGKSSVAYLRATLGFASADKIRQAEPHRLAASPGSVTQAVK